MVEKTDYKWKGWDGGMEPMDWVGDAGSERGSGATGSEATGAMRVWACITAALAVELLRSRSDAVSPSDTSALLPFDTRSPSKIPKTL